MLGTNVRRFGRSNEPPPMPFDWIHLPTDAGPRTFAANVPGGVLIAANDGLVFLPGVKASREGLALDVLRVQPTEIVRDRTREEE